MKRISFAFTSKLEAKILDWLVKRLPLWVTPDFLTLLALGSAFAGGVFYILAGNSLNYLWGVSICLAAHWFGDSLDGRVARYRKIQRPNYGYYVDHILDSGSAALFLGGLTASLTLTDTTAWVWVLALMFLSMTHVFLKTKVFGTFEMSLQQVGPTEARIGLILVNSVVFFLGNPRYAVMGIPATLFDFIGWLGVIAFLIILIPEIIKTAIKLDKKDRGTKISNLP